MYPGSFTKQQIACTMDGQGWGGNGRVGMVGPTVGVGMCGMELGWNWDELG